MNQHLKAVISEILSSSYWAAKTIVESKFSIQSSAEVDQKSPFISEKNNIENILLHMRTLITLI